MKNYLISQTVSKCFQSLIDTVDKILGWKRNGYKKKVSQLVVHQNLVILTSKRVYILNKKNSCKISRKLFKTNRKIHFAHGNSDI